MSIIFPVTIMMAGFCSIVTYFILAWKLKRRPSGCLLTLLSLPVYAVVIFYVLMAVGTTERQHVSAEEANDVLVFFKVPATASDVNCKNSKFGGMADIADFSVSEDGFLHWAKSRGWEPRRFVAASQFEITWPGLSPEEVISERLPTSPVLVSRAACENKEVLEYVSVMNGYYYTNRVGDCGYEAVYDFDMQRAYVLFSKF